MPEDSLIRVDQVIESDTILQKQQELYPSVHNIYNLRVDNSLPVIKFENVLDTLTTTEKKISLSIKIPNKVEKVDLFLLVNKIKRDMFYQVEPGIYNFNSILLEYGENLIEIFYRIDDRKSVSAYSVIIRK